MSETKTATKRNGPLRYFRWWLHTLLLYETLKDARYGYRQKPRAWTYLYDKDRTGDLMMYAPWRNFGPHL